MKVVTSGFLKARKMLAPPEFIRLRCRIKAANRDVHLSAPGQNVRGGAREHGGPDPEVAEDFLGHRRPRHEKTVNHRLAVLE